MPDQNPDSGFRRHVVVAAHTIAYRACLTQNPEATRGAAWEYAVLHWESYLDRAIVFLTARAFREESRGLERRGKK